LLVLVRDQLLQSRDIVRQPLQEREKLTAENRKQEAAHQHEKQNEQADHDEGGEDAGQAHPLEAISGRIQEIGERRAGHERQQHLVQQPDDQDEDCERPEPEQELALQGHRALKTPYGASRRRDRLPLKAPSRRRQRRAPQDKRSPDQSRSRSKPVPGRRTRIAGRYSTWTPAVDEF